ncbi:MAG: hypothetical protein AB7V32_00845 [Candidatus Berkiella sp.]
MSTQGAKNDKHHKKSAVKMKQTTTGGAKNDDADVEALADDVSKLKIKDGQKGGDRVDPAAIDHLEDTVMDIVEREDADAQRIHQQGATVGRIHDNVQKAGNELDDANDDLAATDSCCFAFLQALRDKLCCCCCPTQAPHHADDYEAGHKAPVAFHPANPTGEKQTRAQRLAALREATEHAKETLEGENVELRDQNDELKDVVVEADSDAKKAQDAQKTGNKIVAKK